MKITAPEVKVLLKTKRSWSDDVIRSEFVRSKFIRSWKSPEAKVHQEMQT